MYRFILAVLSVFVCFVATPVEVQAQRTIPNTPRNVRVFVSDIALMLTWQAPSSWGSFPASGYEIDWAEGASPPAHSSSSWNFVSPNLGPDATEYILTNRIYGTTYHLRIRAFSVNPDDSSDQLPGEYVVWSGTLTHTHGPPPGPPTLTLTTRGATSLSFSIACVSPGHAPVTNYVLRAQKTGSGPVIEHSHTVSSPCVTETVTITGLESSTTYRVRARARNLFGRYSALSYWVQATTQQGAGQQGEIGRVSRDAPPAQAPPADDDEETQGQGESGQQSQPASQPDPPVVQQQPQEQRQQEQDDPDDDDESDIPMLSVSLDVDDAEADQSLTALDVFPNRVFSIQIFGTYFQAIDEVFLRFDYDSTKVVYEGFSLGRVSGSTTLPGRNFVVIGMMLSKENPVVDGKSLMGTIRFRTTEAFSDTDIRQVQMKIRVEGEENIRIFPMDQSIALGKATPLPQDFDGNGIVDSSDHLLFVEAFGSRVGQAKYDEKYDLNDDGEIGIDDFLIFMRGFDK